MKLAMMYSFIFLLDVIIMSDACYSNDAAVKGGAWMCSYRFKQTVCIILSTVLIKNVQGLERPWPMLFPSCRLYKNHVRSGFVHALCHLPANSRNKFVNNQLEILLISF
jgi:hypothetical protein